MWLTNAEAISEEVIESMTRVSWHMRGWRENEPVLYGDSRTLFIFDPKAKKLHAFLLDTYLEHAITDVEKRDDLVSFHIRMAGVGDVRSIRDLSHKERKNLRKLAGACLDSRRWLNQHGV